MSSRARGASNQPRGRGFGNNRGAPRNSTRNWDRAPAGTATNSVPKTASGENRRVKQGDQSLQLIPSVSRSSGLEPNGDALRSFETQEVYWKFIADKIMNLEDPSRSIKTPEGQEKESNVMILLRKLREGFVATDRRDSFAIQVVEKSAYLSILYNSPVNVASSFSYLLDAHTSSTTESELPRKSTFNEPAIGLVHFLQTLVDEFPSQRASHRLIFQPRSVEHQTCLPRDSPEWSIAFETASALRRSNWWALERLTDPQGITKRLEHEPWATQDDDVFAKLARRTLVYLLGQLRAKVRSAAWPVLRSAYREVSSAPWLERSLLLHKDGGLVEFMKTAVEKSEAAVKDVPGGSEIDVWVLTRPVAA